MKHRLLFAVLLLVASASAAQTRNINLSWTAPSTAPSGYSIYTCTVPSGATTCTPTLVTPLATVTTTTYTTTGTIGTAYGFSVTANYPVCTLSTPLTTPCGTSTPDTINFVPVPLQGNPATNVVIVVQ